MYKFFYISKDNLNFIYPSRLYLDMEVSGMSKIGAALVFLVKLKEKNRKNKA